MDFNTAENSQQFNHFQTIIRAGPNTSFSVEKSIKDSFQFEISGGECAFKFLTNVICFGDLIFRLNKPHHNDSSRAKLLSSLKPTVPQRAGDVFVRNNIVPNSLEIFALTDPIQIYDRSGSNLANGWISEGSSCTVKITDDGAIETTQINNPISDPDLVHIIRNFMDDNKWQDCQEITLP